MELGGTDFESRSRPRQTGIKTFNIGKDCLRQGPSISGVSHGSYGYDLANGPNYKPSYGTSLKADDVSTGVKADDVPTGVKADDVSAGVKNSQQIMKWKAFQ